MKTIQTVFSRKERPYTGVELRPHFLLSELGLKGSGLGAFIGPCSVKTEHLVDWEDRLAGDHIQAARMVHFIGEFFGATLTEGVLRQRLLVAMVQQDLNLRLGQVLKQVGQADLPEDSQLDPVLRRGDDLMVFDRKLSVSIVTASPVSQLLHLGINIDSAGAPVPAIGLSDLGISAEEWVPSILEGFAAEWQDIEWACAKVRPVV